jgi:hypothetical protein
MGEEAQTARKWPRKMAWEGKSCRSRLALEGDQQRRGSCELWRWEPPMAGNNTAL